jgi:hypothetical protein
MADLMELYGEKSSGAEPMGLRQELLYRIER